MIARRLQDVWYGDRSPGLVLRVLERVYRFASQRRGQGLPDPELEGKPIIIVGNITVGGTGKTPLVIRLAQLLTGAGLKVAVISRGYGRTSKEPVRVDETTSANLAGDEPLLIARRCEVPVFVDANREAAAKRAFSEGADIVISDDGLQRKTLPRRMELCVVDGARGFGNGRLMPAGPLREPIERLASVDAVVVNGESHLVDLPEDAVTMSLRPTVVRMLDGSLQLQATEIKGHDDFQSFTAVAGTGNPQRFFDTLRSLGLNPAQCRGFADHHAFRQGDFSQISDTLLMTEKDAVKCQELELPDAWYLEVDAVLEPSWEQEFLSLCEALLGQ